MSNEIIDGGKGYMLVDDGGLHFLDPAGNTPKINKKGALAEPFLLVVYNRDGSVRRQEMWNAGTRLPLTPTALRLKAAGQLTAADLVAVAGNNEGAEDLAVEQKVEGAPKVGTSKPAPKPTSGKKPAQAAKPSGNGRAAAVAKVKGSASASKPATADGPSKPASGTPVYVRHMRTPRDAFILIKNPAVYGAESNWVTKEEFANAKVAEAWAAKNGLKVANPSK